MLFTHTRGRYGLQTNVLHCIEQTIMKSFKNVTFDTQNNKEYTPVSFTAIPIGKICWCTTAFQMLSGARLPIRFPVFGAIFWVYVTGIYYSITPYADSPSIWALVPTYCCPYHYQTARTPKTHCLLQPVRVELPCLTESARIGGFDGCIMPFLWQLLVLPCSQTDYIGLQIFCLR